MIAETIKQLQSAKWYGCGPTIERAKGKHALPESWKETKEKIRRSAYMQATEAKEQNREKSKKVMRWLSGRK